VSPCLSGENDLPAAKDEERILLSRTIRGDADQLVFFQGVLGTLHIDVLLSRKLRTHLMVGGRPGFEVLAPPKIKSSFQIFANQANHSDPSSLSPKPGKAVDVHLIAPI
jgi:hypothetical protein